MKLFDTHCHLNFEAFSKDYNDVFLRSQKNNVEMLVVGTDAKTSGKAIELAEKFDGVWGAVGFHPIHIENRGWRQEVQVILKLAEKKSVRAIGEIGFDTFNVKPEREQEAIGIQAEILDQFLSVAFKLKKPVIFHCRGPLGLLKKKIEENLVNLKKVGAVVHCFPGDGGFANFLVKNDFFLGFNGIIFKNHQWDKIIGNVPLANILLETDAPYLNPIGDRKSRNEPMNVKYICQRIAELKNIPVEQVARATTRSAKIFLQI